MDGSDTSPSRDRKRIALILGCLLVTVATGLLLPTFATDGLAGSPIDRALPGEGTTSDYSDSGSGDGGLGALHPGDTTGVGGEIGLDSDTFGNTDTDLHFTVRSTTGTYWRTGAYDLYTGDGWERETDTTPLDGPIEHDGIRDERIEYELEFETDASAVPTPWRPNVVEGVDGLQVTDAGAIHSESVIESGTTVTGVSYAPERDVGVLQSQSGTYPSHVEERFTQLPDETPARVEEFTTQLTAGADGPYETAVTIEEWLETEKEYDLRASRESDNIADTFIFDMNRGYCEYFATAMVAMLRSQDIPSRYVVGYSTGEYVGNDTYEVRAMNAHAWVEVYFEDVGWVRFDPTPGEERLSAQEEALEGISDEPTLRDTGSPGEEIEPGNDVEETPPSEEGVQISLNRTAVPGKSVEVTVTWFGNPYPGTPVYFNGVQVGETDGEGVIVATVPDDEELTVAVDPVRINPEPVDVELSSENNVTLDGTNTSQVSANGSGFVTSGGGSLADSGGVLASSGGFAGVSTEQPVFGETGQDREEETFPVERDATIAVTGDQEPGALVLLTVRVGDILIRDIPVTVDGEEVGTTNGDGQLEISLPETTGDVSIQVEDGPITGSQTVTIPELELAVDTGTLPPMALGSVTVEATVGGEPASGVPISIDGEEVATTGTAGTATVTLPFTHEALLSVTAAGQSEQTALSGLLFPLGAIVAIAVPALGGSLLLLKRRGYSVRTWLVFGRSIPGTLTRTMTRGLVVLASRGDEIVLALFARVRNLFAGLFAVVTGQKSREEIRRQVRSTVKTIRRRSGKITRLFRGKNPPAAFAEQELTVGAAWRRFLNQLSVTAPETRTPGELARHAIEKEDLPEEQVRTLRDTFREVEYGPGSETDHIEGLEVTIEEIERAGGQGREQGETE